MLHLGGKVEKEGKEKYKDKDIELEYRIEDVNLRSAPSQGKVEKKGKQKYKDKDKYIKLEYRIEDVNLRSVPSWREILWEILAAPMSREN